MITKVKDETRAKGYTTYSNEIHYNKDLTMNAKYLLMFILSLPTTYDISTRSLVEMTGEGKAKINSALKELKEAGYLVLIQKHENGRLAGNDCVVCELPNEELQLTDFQQAEKQLTENQPHINKITIKEKLEINKIISPSSSNEEKKPQPLAEEKTFAELTVLLNDTCGAEGAERVTTAILKKYGNMSLSLLEKAIELAIKKDIKDVKKLKGYILETLSDWSCRGFTTVEEVEELFRKFKNSKKVIREEMKPDWLNKPQQSYDPDRKYTSEELEIIEQMKAMGKGFIPILPSQSFVDDSLPF